MDKLLNPDTGLIIWTIVTFLALVFILKKMAWGPLLAAIEEREGRIKADLDAAESARAQAERLKQELDSQMNALEARSRERLAEAAREGDALRAKLKTAAEDDARKIREKTMSELDEEKQRLVKELRQEVASLSVMAAEKLIRKSVDDSVQKDVLESFFSDLERQGKHN
ncbi:MAG: F0F1 ATP synthase subunit B [Elusimicrobia bacterium]|nr:F0F1 ATP synthase subunit B [Elusimicrobiota bacterium]